MISPHNASLSQLFLRVGLPLTGTCLLVALTFFLPLIDSTTPPYFDLSQAFSQCAYWFSFSGGTGRCTVDNPFLRNAVSNET